MRLLPLRTSWLVALAVAARCALSGWATDAGYGRLLYERERSSVTGQAGSAARTLETASDVRSRIFEPFCTTEPGVRRLVREILERRAYQVAVAEHGRHALTLLEADAMAVATVASPRIARVVSDVVMPEMGGRSSRPACRSPPRRDCRAPLPGRSSLP